MGAAETTTTDMIATLAHRGIGMGGGIPRMMDITVGGETSQGTGEVWTMLMRREGAMVAAGVEGPAGTMLRKVRGPLVQAIHCT